MNERTYKRTIERTNGHILWVSIMFVPRLYSGVRQTRTVNICHLHLKTVG